MVSGSPADLWARHSQNQNGQRYSPEIRLRIASSLDVFAAFIPTGERKMTAIRRITELKRDDVPFRIHLEDGREFTVESSSSVGIEISPHGSDRIIVFDAPKNKEYCIPVAAIAGISIPEDLDDQRRWTKNRQSR